MGNLQSELLKMKFQKEKKARDENRKKQNKLINKIGHKHGTYAREESLELYIGIDFGTSYIKVCVRDLGREESVVMKLFGHRDGLLPAGVLLNRNTGLLSVKNSTYQYQTLSKKVVHIEYLKLLLAGLEPRDDELLSEAEMKAAAVWLLSAVIAETKKEFRIQEMERCKGKKLNWMGINLGIPTDFFNSDIEKRFNVILNYALFIANEDKIVKKPDMHYFSEYLEVMEKTSDGESLNGNEQISVYPEIAAAANSFVFNRDVRPGYYAYFDIGGGTLDGIVFHFRDRDGGKEIDVVTGKVEPLGVEKTCYRLIHETDGREIIGENMKSMKTALMSGTAVHEVNIKVDLASCRASKDVQKQVSMVMMPLKKRDQLKELNRQDSIPMYIGGGGSYSTWYHTHIIGTHAIHKHGSCGMPKYLERPLADVEHLYPRDGSVDHRRFLIAYGLSIPPGEDVVLKGLPRDHPDADLVTDISHIDYEGIAMEKYGELV